MVNNAATVGRSGVHDFILIRTSAIILALYTFYILGFFVTTNEVTYDVWQGFFSGLCTKVFTILALFSLLVHAWIGIWQVLSDYIKPAFLRGALQFIFAVTLLGYLVMGLLTVWGV
ncbi:succinate dehydrogenase, hydrophobic membrane anchor protein [Colwellia sp. 1_MG-2023]|uniref:Succinate dehydrogenase hydrophobic membrane anchor subunit n=1 Tax=Thalassotalea castellviae TaxID=3075612 RepID=A0ABU3A2X7_9GAMM|nr:MULTISPECIES: succinate dehydrogenase, hydrophobic membrane anchor protein [Colwelliaceae]MDO6445925.1 succinate dehydrogenase, hydrophobic membrane anchor protein [Colwellia sp. 1_MG-2023]MDT0604525.1 succinate dehydrogenase, hydrophobic membrane anchor protein [Thalassotalea sp. W431]